MVRWKVRIRFSKEGDLRQIGHLDLMRTLERALRRAAIPLRMSQGFHPKPRISFPLALGLGMAGLDEVVELELAEALPPDEIAHRLSVEAPPGFRCQSVVALDGPCKARVRSVDYTVPIPTADRLSLPNEIERLLQSSEWKVQRLRSGRRVTLDLRPRLLDLSFDGERLHMQLSVTPEGSVRPEEVLRALNLEHLLEAGAIVTRTRVELESA